MAISDLRSLPRPAKRLILFSVDIGSIVLGLYAAFALRYGTPWPFSTVAVSLPLLSVMLVVGAVLIVAFGLHRIKLQAMEYRGVQRIAACAIALAIFAMAASYLLNLPSPRSVPLILGAVFFLSATGARLAALTLITWGSGREVDRTPVAIYGAGAAGIQLAAALQNALNMRPVAFLDDNPALNGLIVAGLPVCSPLKMRAFLARHGVRRVLLAMPSASQHRRDAITARMKAHRLEVQSVESFVDTSDQNTALESLKDVTIDDLFGRALVSLDDPAIVKTYAGRAILITGAGGHVGQHLARELLSCAPASLVLLDNHAEALDALRRRLSSLAQEAGVRLVLRVASVTQKSAIEGVIRADGIDLILHAAAQSHIALAEDNALETVRINVLGTQVVAEAAQSAGVERMILVSSAGAAAPATMVDASRRMAETVVQDLQTRTEITRLSVVRLAPLPRAESDLLPLVADQILAGGPVTIPDVAATRVFVCAPEIARLLLLAGTAAKGGDVLELDPGVPLKLHDIAERMIHRAGLIPRDEESGLGDIEIVATGLRPGEALHDPMLEGTDLAPTGSDRVLRRDTPLVSEIEVAATLRELRGAIQDNDPARLRDALALRFESYRELVQPAE